jgi:type II secretory pathway pseudopilin PulG
MSFAAHRARAFTLVETLVAIGVTTIVGSMIFLVLNSGMVLYAKNTAINTAHQQARSGVDQMLANLHKAISIPQLTDSSLQPVSELDANGQPAKTAGISFQNFYVGPFPVIADASASDTSIKLFCPGGYTNASSARLNIPSHNIELDISSVTSLGAQNYQFNFASPIGTAISVDGAGIEPTATYVITAFITTRMSYAVVGTELRYFPTNNLASYRVLSRNIISPSPFSIPLLPNGGLQNRFVAAVDLSTAEPSFSNRGYAAVNMFISSLIPFRCRLTNTQ